MAGSLWLGVLLGSIMNTFFRSIFLIVVAFASKVAWACAVCGVANERSEWAFILTTGILTSVPLIFIGVVVFFFKRQWHKGEHDEQSSV